MKKIRISANFAVFVLFFGVATLEAIQAKNWPRVVLWIIVSLVFLAADNLEKPK